MEDRQNTRTASASLAPETLEFRILQDQLADIRNGIFISIPIGSVLAGLILAVHIVSGDRVLSALVWFLAVNLVNGARIVRALTTPKEQANVAQVRSLSRQFKLLAFLSGVVWAFLAVLTDGYTTPESALHLIILAGTSAGAVVYGSSCAAVPLNFIMLPLLTVIGCLLVQGGFENLILIFAVLLFLGGLTRATLRAEARFLESSRLKHEAKQLASEMEQSSKEDPLTGLLNRRGLESAIERIARTGGSFVAMLVDLDGFKSVNDTYGHKVGDDLLIRIAQRISDHAPAGSTLARIGGDEFVLLYPERAATRPPDQLALDIIAAIASPYPPVASVRIGACIGIYRSEKPGLTEMLLRADIALYAAKHRGRNEFCEFNDGLQLELQRRQCIERDLRGAIERGELGVWFQPIVDLETTGIVGLEALLRWRHPLHEEISPPEIVEAARETGLLPLLTETVFRNCCAMIERLQQAGCSDIRVAMNLSPRELENSSIDEMIVEGLRERNLPVSMFEIEITEEAPVDRHRVDERLGRLSDFGISIALDDFGTGFSTLASLKDSRIGKVKIDKDFIGGIVNSRDDQLLVKAVIDLGRAFEIEVMAEGVETEEDCHVLQALGCRIAQGFLFSKALPMDEAIDLVIRKPSEERRRRPHRNTG